MENIKKMEACRTFEDLIRVIFEIRGLDTSGPVYLRTRVAREDLFYIVKGNRGDKVHIRRNEAASTYARSIELVYAFTKNLSLFYFDQDGKCWEAKHACNISMRGWSSEEEPYYSAEMGNVEFKPRKKFYPFISDNFTVNTDEELRAILKKVNPYAGEYLKDKPDLSPARFLLCPALEILYKAGYAFAEEVAQNKILPYNAGSRVTMFDRLVRYDGKNPREIFKTTKAVYRLLIDEPDLAVWDNLRKMVKKDPGISAGTLRLVMEENFSSNEIKLFYEILAKTSKGVPLFTIQSLLNYLGRLDTYEAIESGEALILLRDYLVLCRRIGMEPKVDGDSLKREHDIASRIFRHMDNGKKKNDFSMESFRKAAERNAAYDYEEDVFFARAIRDYDDLIEERNQQHNCVSCYAKDIAEGKTAIYVVRRKAMPDRSLVTAEIRDGAIVQKYLKYNVKVRNRAVLGFLNRWQKHINAVRKAAV